MLNHLVEYGTVYKKFMGDAEYNSLTELARYMSHKGRVMGELGKVSPAPTKLFHMIMEGFAESGTPLGSLFTRMYNTLNFKSSWQFAALSSGVKRLEANKTIMQGEAINRLITGMTLDAVEHPHSFRRILEAFNKNAPDAETKAEKWLTEIMDKEMKHRWWVRPGLGAQDGARGSEHDMYKVKQGDMSLEGHNEIHEQPGRRSPQGADERADQRRFTEDMML